MGSEWPQSNKFDSIAGLFQSIQIGLDAIFGGGSTCPAKLQNAQLEVAHLHAGNKILQNEIASYKAGLAFARQEFESCQRGSAYREKELEACRRSLAYVQKEIQACNRQLADKEQRLEKCNYKVVQLKNELHLCAQEEQKCKDTESADTRTISKLKSQIAELNRQIGSLKNQLTVCKQKLSSWQANYDSLLARYNQLKSDYALLYKDYQIAERQLAECQAALNKCQSSKEDCKGLICDPQPGTTLKGVVQLAGKSCGGSPVWAVDGADFASGNHATLDTRKLANGRHDLELNVVGADGARLCVANESVAIDNPTGPPPKKCEAVIDYPHPNQQVSGHILLRAHGSGGTPIWYVNGNPLCRGFTCDWDTTQLSAGRYRLDFGIVTADNTILCDAVVVVNVKSRIKPPPPPPCPFWTVQELHQLFETILQAKLAASVLNCFLIAEPDTMLACLAGVIAGQILSAAVKNTLVTIYNIISAAPHLWICIRDWVRDNLPKETPMACTDTHVVGIPTQGAGVCCAALKRSGKHPAVGVRVQATNRKGKCIVCEIKEGKKGNLVFKRGKACADGTCLCPKTTGGCCELAAAA